MIKWLYVESFIHTNTSRCHKYKNLLNERESYQILHVSFLYEEIPVKPNKYVEKNFESSSMIMPILMVCYREYFSLFKTN